MPRRRRTDAIRLKVGGGTGYGKHFIPFLKTRDVPSFGLSHRILGIKTGRIHHLLSNLEKYFFLILDFSPHVTDIREQFPLPLQETLDICRRFNLRHPLTGSPAYPIVMSTDFLIDECRNDLHRLIARTVKPASKLSQRTLEKFEIERIYWEERGVDWGIVIDNDIPRILCRNLEWLHPAYFPTAAQTFPDEIKIQTEGLLFDWSLVQPFTPFTALTRKVDERLGLLPGSALWMARHFLSNKIWSTDLNVPIRLDKQLIIQRGHSYIEPRRLAA